MNLINNSFAEMDNISLYPIISLSLFFLVFIMLLIWVYTRKKSEMAANSKLPLED